MKFKSRHSSSIKPSKQLAEHRYMPRRMLFKSRHHPQSRHAEGVEKRGRALQFSQIAITAFQNDGRPFIFGIARHWEPSERVHHPIHGGMGGLRML